MTSTDIISVIGLIGLGGLLKSILDFFIENKRIKSDAKHDFKQTRYKAIILQCFSLINFAKEKDKLLIHRPDLKTQEILFDEIFVEWTNMTLYASDKVIQAMRNFLKNPNQDLFNNLILAMRRDLYGIRTSLKSTDLILEE
jgi:hypothetical protein